MLRPLIRQSSTKLTFLTFEEICPTWSNKLKANLDNDDLHTLIRKPEMCIVGEAWGHTSRYLGYRVVYLIPFIGCWNENNKEIYLKKKREKNAAKLNMVIN